MSESPQILIIAGPNGAGKITFAREFLPHEAECPDFINADLIAAGRRNLERRYARLVNAWKLYDNSGTSPRLLAQGENP